MAWDYRVTNVKVLSFHSRAIHTVVQFAQYKPRLMSVIYASNHVLVHNSLWNDQIDKRGSIAFACCNSSISIFHNLVNYVGFFDLGFRGCKFT